MLLDTTQRDDRSLAGLKRLFHFRPGYLRPTDQGHHLRSRRDDEAIYRLQQDRTQTGNSCVLETSEPMEQKLVQQDLTKKNNAGALCWNEQNPRDYLECLLSNDIRTDMMDMIMRIGEVAK